MSSIEIRKYEYQADGAKNYFASPTYVDGISLTSIHVDGFPIYNEEFQNQFDSFEFVASDFDLVFSRLEATLTTNGETLEAFLSHDLDNHCLACKVDISGKIFGGLIDVNSIKFIDNLDSDGYKIQLTIFDWAKEFSSYTQGKPTTANGGTINSYLGSNLFRSVDGTSLPTYFDSNTDSLDWNTRVGYVPVIIRELWFHIISSGKADSCSTWKLFEDLCKAFGLIYKFTVIGEVGNYYWISLNIAFRDTGFSDANEVSLEWITRERGYISDINANVIQCFKFMKEEPLSAGTNPADPNEDHFYGTVFNKDYTATYDGDVPAGYSFEEGIYASGEGISLVKVNDPFPFNVTDRVNTVDMNYYFDSRYTADGDYWYYVMGNSAEYWFYTPQIRLAKYISFPRMFTKTGYTVNNFSFPPTTQNITYIAHTDDIHAVWYDLIESTCGRAYKYLLSTLKMYAQGKISLMSSFNINLFDYDTIGHSVHKIFKLSNLDKQNREVEVYMVSD